MINYWLITTDHLEDRLLFRDTDDFCVGMNYVAVQVHKCQVDMLSFILMSNHLHFVLCCSYEKAEQFINNYKKEYSRYLRSKYGYKEHLRGNEVDIRLIPVENESLERAVAYVQMNCVAANICSAPGDYPWGTGSCFFNVAVSGIPGSPSQLEGMKGSRPLAGISARERYRLIRSKADLPGEWLMTESGYIHPSSYVSKVLIERMFRTPKRMNYFLQNSSKAKLRLEIAEEKMANFKDQVIVAALPDLCRTLFHKRYVHELPEEQMAELLRQIRFRFSANVNQIARVTGLSYERAAAFLDRA